MPYRISKVFGFSASHVLTGLPEGHPCGRVHGHNYQAELVLESDGLDQHGFVVDYRDLCAFETYLDATFDHHHLNDVLPMQPSAENIARHLYEWTKERWPQVCTVRVSETPRTWAAYQE